MHQKLKHARPLIGLAALALAGAAAAEIQVQVNGNPVQFGAAQPVRVEGRVLIPLRAVVEALGADVKWDPSTQTVRGAKGSSEFTLRIGARQATVNGKDTTLDVPAQLISGATMVPLRFVAEALGAEVEWNAAAQQVVVNAAAGEPEAAPAPDRIEGEIVAIRPAAKPPTLTVQADGIRHTYQIDPEAIVLRGESGKRGAPVDLEALRPGDQVRLRVRGGDRIETLEAFEPKPEAPAPAARGERVEGEVIAVRDRGATRTLTVRTESGRASYEITADTVLFRVAGTGKRVRAELDELEVGDTVRIRLDPTGRIAEVVDARGTAAEAPAPQPEPARDLRISSFSHDAGGTLKADAQVRFTLRGTPGAVVTFDAGSLAKNQPMREDPQQLGRYAASLTIPKGVTARDVPVIAQLKVGSRTAPLIQAATTLDIDSEPPVISETAPADKGETTNAQPDIYAEISDGAGSGVDPGSVRLTVRDKDVSDLVKVTSRFVIFTPKNPLAAGVVPVVFSVKDQAGNQSQRSWTFTVRQAAAAIQSVSHDADRPLRAGDVVNVTVKGQPRSRVTFSIGEIATGIRLSETSPGVYTGRYTVKEGDQAAREPVTVELVTPDGGRVKQESTAPVNILTREPESPEIISPGKRIQLGDELVVEGNAAPGSKVVVEVTFTGRAFGALPVKGTFGSQEAKVDKDGRWVTEPFVVRLPLGVKKPELTIRAVSVDSAGTESKPTEQIITTTR